MFLSKIKNFVIVFELIIIVILVYFLSLYLGKNKITSIIPNPESSNNSKLKASYFDDSNSDSIFSPRSNPIPVIHPLAIKPESIKITSIQRSQIKIDNPMIQSAVDENYKNYNAFLAGYFSNKGEAISSVVYADVNNDKVNETIVTTANAGQNHPPHNAYIIKNNVIILYVPLDSGSIKTSKSGNGFYVENAIRDDGQPYCCPSGYRIYRVIFENGSFKPVWEQDVKYLQFGQ